LRDRGARFARRRFAPRDRWPPLWPPLLLVDLGVPRNFASGVHGLDGTYLCDLDDLARVSNANLKARLAEVDRARIALAEKAARAWGAANHQTSSET
jgi:glutamyl-tRNA reductase